MRTRLVFAETVTYMFVVKLYYANNYAGIIDDLLMNKREANVIIIFNDKQFENI